MDPNQIILLQLARLRLSEAQKTMVQNYLPLIDWNKLFALAHRGGVAGIVAQHLTEFSVPPRIKLRFVKAALAIQRINKLFMEEVRELCSAAEEEHLTLVPLKGAALNMGLPYNDLGMRPMCDLDLLARPGEIAQIDVLLKSRGYDRGHSDYLELKFHHHLTYVKHKGKDAQITVELHWNATGILYEHPQVSKAIFDRLWMHSFQGTRICFLHPEDMLLFLLVHIAVHRYRGPLKWLVDVVECAELFKNQISWSNIWDKARTLGALHATIYAAKLVEELFSVSIPMPPCSLSRLALLERLAPAKQIVAHELPYDWSRKLWPLTSFIMNDSWLASVNYVLIKCFKNVERRFNVRVPDYLIPYANRSSRRMAMLLPMTK